MIHDPYIVPPLPASWPYPPGHPLMPLGCRINQNLPGLGGGWRLCTPGGMALAGEAEPLTTAFGRGGIFRVGEVVVRPYRRGGLLRRLNDRTYRTHLRFAAEHAVHRGLWEAGFPTVEPLGYAWRPVRLGVEGVMLTRYAAGTSWPHGWDFGTDRMAELRRAIASLCGWGLWSPDLNATNVMFPPEGGVLLLDWDRARFVPEGEDLWPRYRARLERSLRKLGAPPSAFQVIGSAPRP